MKTCTICKRDKELDEFHKHPGTSDGRGSQCKSCDREQKKQRANQKKEILVAELGGKCSACGYDRCIAALEFHHLLEKEFEISRCYFLPIEMLREEAKKCVLLCANCHREQHDLVL